MLDWHLAERVARFMELHAIVVACCHHHLLVIAHVAAGFFGAVRVHSCGMGMGSSILSMVLCRVGFMVSVVGLLLPACEVFSLVEGWDARVELLGAFFATFSLLRQLLFDLGDVIVV